MLFRSTAESRSQSQSTEGNGPKPAPGAGQRPAPIANQIPNAAPKPVPPSGSPAAPQTAPDAATAITPDERAQRLGRLVAEYRQLQTQVNVLNFDELTLINQANMLKLMLRFEQGGAGGASALGGQRQADLTTIQRRLDDIGTKKAEMVKRMNELAVEYRVLQQGNT